MEVSKRLKCIIFFTLRLHIKYVILYELISSRKVDLILIIIEFKITFYEFQLSEINFQKFYKK